MAEPETYNKPDHGWTCFHCGETFTTIGTARDHFGFEPSVEPGCRIKLGAERGLLMALRRAEKDAADAWQAISSETTDAAKAYHAACARHVEQLRTAEEVGYERGLYDRNCEMEKMRAALVAAMAIIDKSAPGKKDAAFFSAHADAILWAHADEIAAAYR